MIWAVDPFKCHASKVGAIDFFRDFVVLLESLAKMIQVGIANVLNGKVVNNECERDEVPLVMPETGGGGCLVVVKFGQMVLEEVVSKDALLGEDRTCHGAFQSRSRSHGQAIELVLISEFLGDVRKLDADVLWPVDRSS
jgi:hypothetical protein